MHIKLLGCNGRFTHSTLSLFYIRECFISNLPKATISLYQQAINDSYYKSLLSLTDNQPDIICFSVYIWNHQRIKQFILDLKQFSPDTQIIIGGPEAGRLQALQHPKLCLVKGEVEGLSADFYKDLQAGQMKTKYTSTPAPVFSSPYCRSDFTTHLANRHIYYESSRGCPYQCSYCLSSTNINLRHLPVPQIIHELDFILSHNPRIIRFIDRTFNAIPARTIEIWEYLINLDTSCRFHFEISPDIFTPEMFNVLKKVPTNRFQFEIGLQSTNPETLHQVKRKTTIVTALANIRKLVQLETIHLHVDLILGLPAETCDTYKKSFNDVFRLGCHYIQMGLLKILPDTPIIKNNPELIASNHPPYELLASPYLTPDNLKELYLFGECVEKFHNTQFFKPLFSYLRQKNENGFDFFMNLLKICKDHDFFNKAATQKLLSEMLVYAGTKRNDLSQYLEILQFCWLYSGMRKLPNHLPALDMQELKKSIYKNCPQNYPPYFNHTNRNLFFRQTEFAAFSKETIQTIMPQCQKDQILCFRPSSPNKETIFKQAEVIIFNLKKG
jgi:radical SAM superfamily enzyme YgiQ (UPF0313 family)